MPKYIRTKDKILDISKHTMLLENQLGVDIKIKTFKGEVVIDQADNIEELICDDDILYIYDLYPDAVLVVEGNIKPFGYNTAIKLKEWLEYKPKFDLFIKDSRGNYIKTAKMNESGVLELL